MKVYQASSKNRVLIRSHLPSVITVKLIGSIILLLTVALSGLYWQRQRITYHLELVASELTMYISRVVYPVETIHMDIGFTQFQQIEQKRQEALDKGMLVTQEGDMVEAQLTYKEVQIPVELRLKGDWLDHLQGERWAFRVETKGDTAFEGMSRFSLQPPSTRNFLQEWLLLSALREVDVIALRYWFTSVVLNGDRKGIYAVEEHFTKELLEANQRREAPIVKWNEDYLWETQDQLGVFDTASRSIFEQSTIDIFQAKRVIADPSRYQQYQRASQLLSALRDQSLPVTQIIDTQTWAKFIALTDLFGAHHGLAWHNLRFYYNPLSDRLEPVPFDLMAGQRINVPFMWGVENEDVLQYLFTNSTFQERYLEFLSEISQTEYVSKLLEKHQKDINHWEKIIRHDDVYQFESKYLYDNAQMIRYHLAPKHPLIFRWQPKGLQVTNVVSVPIEILSLSTADQTIPLDSPVVLDHTQSQYTLDLNQSFIKSIVSVKYRLPYGESQERTQAVTYPIPPPRLSQGTQLRNHPQGIVSEAGRSIRLAGRVTLDQIYLVDQGYEVVVLPGTQLTFQDQAGIISESPINIAGTVDEPVLITGSDKSYGIFVKGSAQRSNWQYVRISNLGAFNLPNWKTTGAVTFYQSPVTFDHILITGGRAEDQLNLVDTEVDIRQIRLNKSQSDALDIDFGKGKITELSCYQSGNDCLDLSQSQFSLGSIVVEKAKDKGLSFGEQSTVSITWAHINSAYIGMAVKDDSKVEVDELSITDTVIPVAVYQKKPEYGPAHAHIHLLDITNSKQGFVIEQDSSVLYFDRIWGDQKNVYTDLYPEDS